MPPAAARGCWGSSRSPATIACSGHTTTQLGSKPSVSRCAQKLHLAAVWVSGSMYRASYGHACRHDLQPMQRSELKSTTPSLRRNSAVTGQIVTHGVRSQWLQRVTVKSRRLSGKGPFSTYFTQVRSTPIGTWCSLARHRAGVAADALAIIDQGTRKVGMADEQTQFAAGNRCSIIAISSEDVSMRNLAWASPDADHVHEIRAPRLANPEEDL